MDWETDYDYYSRLLRCGEGRHIMQKPEGIFARLFKIMAGEAASHSAMIERGEDGKLYIRETSTRGVSTRIPLKGQTRRFMAGPVRKVAIPFTGPDTRFGYNQGTCANNVATWIGMAKVYGWSNNYMSPGNLYRADMGYTPYLYQMYRSY